MVIAALVSVGVSNLQAKARIAAAFLAVLCAPSVASGQSALLPAVPTDSEAPIALLVNVTSGQVLHARDENRRFVPASMTKAMTTFLAFELMEEGVLQPTEVLTIRPETWREWNGKGSTMWLPADARIRVDELLTGITTVSANDGSIVLAEGHAGSVAAWTMLMNEKALSIGMTNSRFGTPNGWPDEGKTFTTARDLVTLGAALTSQHPQKYARFIGRRQFTYNGITQSNRDPLVGSFEGGDGIKTGYTNESGFGFLGTAKRDGQRLVMVIGGVSSQSGRARLAKSYLEWGFSAFDSRRVVGGDKQLGFARVQNGTNRRVALVTDGPVFVNVPKGQSPEVSVAITYDGPLRAPIAAGEQVASLQISVEGMEPANVPLLAKEDVGEAGVFDRLINGLTGWFP